jgi:hypothetical protein
MLALLCVSCTAEDTGQNATLTPPRADAAGSSLACALLAEDAGALTASEPVSFEQQVIPLLGLSCNFGSCHMGVSTGGFPGFGPKCTYDPVTTDCPFDPGALSPEVLDTVHGNLLAPSNKAPNLARVEPGDVTRSFLLIKLAGCQDLLPDLTGCPDCGVEMPPGSALRDSSPSRFELLARWVAQGAPRQ